MKAWGRWWPSLNKGRSESGIGSWFCPSFLVAVVTTAWAGDYIYCEDSYDFAGLHGSTAGAGTFAHYTLKPAWLLPKLPEDVSFAQATMAIDGIGASFGGFEAIGVSSQDTVLITGLGPVGLGAVVNARFRNARVIGVEPAPWRAHRALEMGAEAVLDPNDPDILQQIRSLTGGRGVDCAIDCSGRVSSERLCIDATRRRGRVAFVGECGDEVSIRVSPDLIRKGLTIRRLLALQYGRLRESHEGHPPVPSDRPAHQPPAADEPDPDGIQPAGAG